MLWCGTPRRPLGNSLICPVPPWQRTLRGYDVYHVIMGTGLGPHLGISNKMRRFAGACGSILAASFRISQIKSGEPFCWQCRTADEGERVPFGQSGGRWDAEVPVCRAIGVEVPVYCAFGVEVPVYCAFGVEVPLACPHGACLRRPWLSLLGLLYGVRVCWLLELIRSSWEGLRIMPLEKI